MSCPVNIATNAPSANAKNVIAASAPNQYKMYCMLVICVPMQTNTVIIKVRICGTIINADADMIFVTNNSRLSTGSEWIIFVFFAEYR